MKHLLFLCVFLLSLQDSSKAGIGEDLGRFFLRAGSSKNFTAPGSFKDQSAGFYTGGSMAVRNTVRSADLASIQMPGFRAGCGGIDAWMGGFSHISSAQLVSMLRNVGSSAASYAFMLAIQTVSPQIYNIMNELNALATQINQTNINSCEVAATMLGGIWPKTDQSSKHLCQAMGSNLGVFSDWSAARQGCGAGGERESVLRRQGSDPKYKDMLVGSFNLSWKAIQANAFLRSDPELAQLFMTLVGTIIVREGKGSFEVINLPPHADREDVMNGLLNGGDTPIYRCDNDLCLNPTPTKIRMSDTNALLKKTTNILDVLIKKIYLDEAITEEEKAFLNSTQLPVYKMLNVTTAFRRGAAPVDIHHYAGLIALDILYKYVIEVIEIIHDSVVQLKSVQVDEAHMTTFLDSLSAVRQRIIQNRQSAYQQMDTTLSFVQATQLIEKQLHAMLGSVANETNWL
jgi:conjugative transfer pilus assembly protein TraH